MRFIAAKRVIGAFFLALIASSAAFSEVRAAESRDAAVIVDGVSGKVLYERNADAPRFPASLTKMMTLYLLFDALEEERITLDTTIVASAHAAAQTPTKLNVPRGRAISIETAIEAIVVRSANDVAVMVGEALGGSEDVFAEMMTDAARALGMNDTTFKNASGLPDLEQRTTARDMALLGRRLAYDFPQYYHYLSATSFRYAGQRYRGHNNVLVRYEGADGIKTGYIRRSGFNLVTSAIRNNTHLVAVVMGGRTAAQRDQEMIKLLDQYFAKAEADRAYTAWANVPWKDEPGYKTLAFYDKPEVFSMLPAIVPSPKPQAESHQFALVGSNDTPTEQTRQSIFGRFGERSSNYSLSSTIGPLAFFSPNSSASDRADAEPVEKTAEYDGQGDINYDVQPGMNSTQEVSAAAAPGVWVVQVGTYPNEEIAISQLNNRQITDVASAARKIIEQVTLSDGRQAFSARLGYFDELSARDLCARLGAQNISCQLARIDS